MVKLFFQLSGEHPTLPFAELRSIFEAEGRDFTVLGKLKQVMRIEAETESIESVVRRAAMTRSCNVEVVYCDATFPQVLREVRTSPLEDFIEDGESFAVRIRRIEESAITLRGTELERKLGEIILDKVKGIRVNLTNPDKTFFGVLTGKKFIFGMKLAEIVPKLFSKRRPKKRPFFHPSAMPPKLARCMVNLARPKADELVLDPLCGTASMLLEAGLIGCRVVGLDIQRLMVKGSLRNLKYFDVKPEGMAVADVRNIPIIQTDCVVTDPPYGRASTTRGRETKQVVKDLFAALDSCIPKGKYICIAAPQSMSIGKLAEDFGFKCMESHVVYVHRSLTREIVVLEQT